MSKQIGLTIFCDIRHYELSVFFNERFCSLLFSFDLKSNFSTTKNIIVKLLGFNIYANKSKLLLVSIEIYRNHFKILDPILIVFHIKSLWSQKYYESKNIWIQTILRPFWTYYFCGSKSFLEHKHFLTKNLIVHKMFLDGKIFLRFF